MSASNFNEIKTMVERGIGKDYSHVIIVCDTFDHEDYPVYVKDDENIYSIIDEYNKNMQKVMEVYNYNMDIEKQLNEDRTYNIKCDKEIKRKEFIEKYPEAMTKSEMALEFATKKHEGQFRKGKNKRPYIEHPIMVAGLIEKYKGNSHAIDELKAASYLHDTLEDTDTTFEELVKKFGIQVASLVVELTNIDEFKDEMGKAKYQAINISHISNWAFDIKLCDILANLSDLAYVDDNNFINKFVKEKIHIISYQLKNRNLTKTQKVIIKDIISIIKIIINYKLPKQLNNEEFKYILEQK